MFNGKMLPEDWDRPSEENHELCRLFRYGEFIRTEGKISYRYFVPAKKGKCPLVIYLHGADAFGEDNELPLELHEIGTMFVRPSWQSRHPCYILAPQCRRGTHWSRPEMLHLLQELAAGFLHEYSDTDRERIYIYGYSAGAAGLLGLLKRYPHFYAGAVPICGATSGKEIEKLKEIPMWLVHAADDQIVRVSYGKRQDREYEHFGSRDIWNYFGGGDRPDMKYTEYPEGYMRGRYGVNPHCSWAAVSGEEGREIREWLFSQKK